MNSTQMNDQVDLMREIAALRAENEQLKKDVAAYQSILRSIPLQEQAAIRNGKTKLLRKQQYYNCTMW